ncbi:pre-RNA processing PIH1/Nop17-domain-containing protein [Pholiota molesta]|nr:pre-RNA processing PIH1/Nop17-domain-containing protein [Pholiota molesta]
MASSSRAHPPAQTRIQLAPKAGFCTTLLEPPSAPRPVPQGTKVFVNIAWDANVPPPPEGSEEAVQRAMRGVEPDAQGADAMAGVDGAGEWYVPVIVSPPREDTDKAGKPSLVFDCIYNSGVKARTLRDPEFKIFLVELALQRIEAQTGLTLSRAIATPNIASKGKLAPRSVLIPTALLPGAPRTAQRTEAHPAAMDMDIADSGGAPSGKGKQRGGAPLIEEISPSPAGAKPSTTSTALPGLKGILKKPLSASPSASPTALRGADAGMDVDVDERAPLEWDWTATEKDKGGKTRLKITVRVPGLTPALIQHAALDLGPRSLSLHIPRRAPLDLDLAVSDAEIVARVGGAYAADTGAPGQAQAGAGAPRTREGGEDRDRRRQAAVERALRLKRQRDFDVEGAEAEWRLGSGEVVVYV